jgi:acyl-CoA thioester hydrolase
MQLLDESLVGEHEIDSLGHLNVRFYMVRVERANAVLMSSFGITPELLQVEGLVLNRIDTYCRYYREQFVGAALTVHGGPIEVHEDRIRLFFDVRNAVKGEIAAAYIIEMQLQEISDRTPRAFTEQMRRRGEAAAVTLPAHGAPRSVPLAPPRIDLTLAQLEARVGAQRGSFWGGSLERVVQPEECDAHGFLQPGSDLFFGARSRIPRPEGQKLGPAPLLTDEGHRFNFALAETRVTLLGTARSNDVLRIVGGDIALHEKTRHSRRWIFNLRNQQLIGVDDTVGIALDLDIRKAIPIPTAIREKLAKRLLAELA